LQHFAELLALHTTWLLDERESKQRGSSSKQVMTESMLKQEEAQPRGKDAKTTSACR
jgi:hypothetical protein